MRAATAASAGTLAVPAARVARVAQSVPGARVVTSAADTVPTLRTVEHTVERAAEAVEVAPARASASPVTAIRDAGLGQQSVRIFFSRMLAATPEGLTIDFTRWQTASVERFFLAITSPGLIRRREAPTTGDASMTLPTAFDGFEWD